MTVNAKLQLQVFGWRIATLNLNVDLIALVADDDAPARPAIRPVITRGVKAISNIWVRGMIA